MNLVAMRDELWHMFSVTPNLSIIREKRQAAATRAAALAEELTRLQSEIADYDAAERVLLALGARETTASLLAVDAPAAARAHETRKPPKLPPVSDMIIEALSFGEKEGYDRLSTRDLLDYVRHTYWPDAKPNDVISTAWRMWKHGKLQKDGKTYSLLNSAPATANELGRETGSRPSE
jgi:hypothetical protein